MVDRTHREFTDADISKIADTYHRWHAGQEYADVPGFCKSATLEEIRKHEYVLTPGRYVGMEATEDDDIPFAERFAELKAKLVADLKVDEELSQKIQSRLERVAS